MSSHRARNQKFYGAISIEEGHDSPIEDGEAAMEENVSSSLSKEDKAIPNIIAITVFFPDYDDKCNIVGDLQLEDDSMVKDDVPESNKE